MRGSSAQQTTMFSVADAGELIPGGHPIRRIRPLVESALARMEPAFAEMYAEIGRPSIPPERLLKASLLMALYSIRSERQFCEQLQYNLLFKWFLGMNLEEPAFSPTSFSKNRKRMLRQGAARWFFAAVVEEAETRRLMSNEHFTVDGTLLESWASLKSLKPKPNLGGQRKPRRGRGGGPGGRNPEVDFHQEKRSNQTHQSTTDPEAQLARKGSNLLAKLCYTGHVLMENRSGLVVDIEVSQSNGRAEREVALKLLHRHRRRARRSTVGADKGYDTKDFVRECRALGVTPHVAQNENPTHRSAINRRTTVHTGYASSQRCASEWKRSSAGSRRWVVAGNCDTWAGSATRCGRS